jgi:hypothetical protein
MITVINFVLSRAPMHCALGRLSSVLHDWKSGNISAHQFLAEDHLRVSLKTWTTQEKCREPWTCMDHLSHCKKTFMEQSSQDRWLFYLGH